MKIRVAIVVASVGILMYCGGMFVGAQLEQSNGKQAPSMVVATVPCAPATVSNKAYPLPLPVPGGNSLHE